MGGETRIMAKMYTCIISLCADGCKGFSVDRRQTNINKDDGVGSLLRDVAQQQDETDTY